MPRGQNAAATRRVLHALSAVFGLGALVPGTDASAAEPAEIVVVATRVAESGFELPVAVDRVGSRAIAEGQPGVNLSESLLTVPGLSVQNRQNYAQDLQLSIRGFGARSSFGVRGVRLYAMARLAAAGVRVSAWGNPGDCLYKIAACVPFAAVLLAGCGTVAAAPHAASGRDGRGPGAAGRHHGHAAGGRLGSGRARRRGNNPSLSYRATSAARRSATESGRR